MTDATILSTTGQDREGLAACTFTTNQIAAWPIEAREELQAQLQGLFGVVFPRMDPQTREDWVSDYFKPTGSSFRRHAILKRNQEQSLMGTALFDTGPIGYEGKTLHALYVIVRAVLPEYREWRLGPALAVFMVRMFQPDILLTTCAQSATLHSWLRLNEKGLLGRYEACPRLEWLDGKEVVVFPKPEDMDFVRSAFRQVYRRVVPGNDREVERAMEHLGDNMVRKDHYGPMYDFDPWKVGGRHDKLAERLGVTDRDGILLMLQRKGRLPAATR